MSEVKKRGRGGQVRPPSVPENAIAELRRRTGWSQDHVAERLGVTRGAVSHWETGRRSIPGPVRILVAQLLEGLS